MGSDKAIEAHFREKLLSVNLYLTGTVNRHRWSRRESKGAREIRG